MGLIPKVTQDPFGSHARRTRKERDTEERPQVAQGQESRLPGIPALADPLPDDPDAPLHAKARRLADVFVAAEKETAKTIEPIAHEALRLGVESWEDLCSRLRGGEPVEQKHFVSTLNAMHDTLFSAPGFRWQGLRAMVDRLLEETERPRHELGVGIRDVQEGYLRTSEFLRESFEGEAPDGLGREMALARQKVQDLLEKKRIEESSEDEDHARA